MHWFTRLFHRRELFDDLSEEMRLHLEERAQQLERDGLTPQEAARRARIGFGNPALAEERSREVWQWPALESLAADLRLAARRLRRDRGFTWTAILTLALAIGANAIVFSVMDAFLLRPLNVPHPESLYALWRVANSDAQESYADFLDMQARNHSFTALAAYNVAAVGVSDGGDGGPGASVVWTDATTGNYFDAVQLHPYLGRFFHASDDRGPNSAPYVVLSFAYWQRQYQSDRRVLGRQIGVNGHPFTILGVAPPGFRGTLSFFNPGLFIPIVNSPMLGITPDLNSRANRWLFMVMGNLKPGVTPSQATQDLTAIASSLAKQYPQSDTPTTFRLEDPSLYGEFLGGPLRAFLGGLLLLASLILLAACANLGSLFAARAADRTKDIALRLALGAGRLRILRALFLEAILTSLAGCALGLVASMFLLQKMSAWQPFPRWPLQISVTPDAKVYAFAVLLALLSGLIFGAVPVRQVLRTDPNQMIKSGAKSGPRRRLAARDLLLVAQIAIGALLVTASMVAVRGLTRSLHSPVGFDVPHTLEADVDLSLAGYTPSRDAAFEKRILAAAATLPGVSHAGLTDSLPLDQVNNALVFSSSTSDLRPSNAAANPFVFNVAPGYLAAADTRLLAGRAFTWHDDAHAPRVAVVNATMARSLFGSVPHALGSVFQLHDGTHIQVVGVAENGKYNSLTETPHPAIFLPLAQNPSHEVFVLLRTARNPLALAPGLRAAVHQLDPTLPVVIESRYQSLDTKYFGPRMATVALGILGLMGAMLSITGIFGMAAYAVSQRRKELGIRIALGAQRHDVLRTALGRSVVLLAAGSAAGLLLGLAASRILAFLVYQATPRDPVVVAAAVAIMLLVGLLAAWIPAHRALALHPSTLLRED